MFIPIQVDGDLDPAIHSQITGSQRAFEVRTEVSRFSQKSPAMPAAKTTVAICGGID
jgi:ribosomal protein L31